jgi:hypothetical protein
MFPFHTKQTIESVLEENHGALDTAITQLLTIPPELPTSDTITNQPNQIKHSCTMTVPQGEIKLRKRGTYVLV